MAREETRDGSVGSQGGLEPGINLIQADSRGNWEPPPSSPGGRCQDSNYSQER